MYRCTGALLAVFAAMVIGATFSQAAGNDAPTSGPPEPYAGVFKNDRLTLTLVRDEKLPGKVYGGKAELAGRTFGVDAQEKDGALAGSFRDDAGNSFPFSAKLDGDALVVQSGRTTYKLINQKPKAVANPFDEPAGNPLKPANPFSDPAANPPKPANPFADVPAGPGPTVGPGSHPIPGPGADNPAGGQVGGVGVMVQIGNDGNIRVAALKPDGPAARAGIREGDVLLEVDGKMATSVKDPSTLVRGQAGTDVKLVMERDAKRLEFIIKREAMNLPPIGAGNPAPGQPGPGNPGANRTGGIGIDINIDAQGAIIITNIKPGGPAANSALRRGDRIVGIDGKAIRGVEDLVARLPGEPNSPVKVTVLRGRETVDFDMKRDGGR